MKTAVFSTKSYDREYLNRFNAEKLHHLVFFEAPLNADTANLTKGFEAVCVFVNDTLTKETIELIAENGVKIIALRCAGFNNVDLEAAENHGIKVVRVPAYSPHAVAEHAVALILTLNRKTHKAYNRIRENNFSLEKLTGFDLFGKTVGVIGTGKIGAIFSNIMQGFGCKIVAYDHYRDCELITSGVDYMSFDRLLSLSDIISLHCPLTPETFQMINKNSFSKMKQGVMLINTSRGKLINTKDAIDALKNGKLGYLGVDVYEQEENLFFKDLSESIIQDDVISRLMSFPNVLITSHQGFFTKEALEQIAVTTLKNLSDFENNVLSENEVAFEQAKK
jgi:D-lactate dehydrogenase